MMLLNIASSLCAGLAGILLCFYYCSARQILNCNMMVHVTSCSLLIPMQPFSCSYSCKRRCRRLSLEAMGFTMFQIGL